jgi:NADPH2:quinone reductase
MKAIQVSKPGGPEALELVELPLPQAKSNGAVVEISASGVNYIDINLRSGAYKAPLPFIAGQEGAGVITSVGDEAKSLKIGDRVALSGILGSYAEYVGAPADALVPIPTGVSDRDAAAATLQGMTAHYLCNDAYPLKSGETALVHAAAGGVGLLLVQMAHHLGARVIGTVSSEEKAKLAREAGADEVILYTETDFEATTKKLTGGKGVDVVYDSVGKATFDKSMNVLRPRGMLVLYGASSGPVPPVDPQTLAQKGSIYMARTTLAHFTATRTELLARSGAVFGMIADGKLKLRIAHTYPLTEAQQAHRDLEGRKTTGKLLLIP